MEIRPFRGWHYAQTDISSLIAPPYDVLSLQDKQRLLAASQNNIVAVDLPHVPPKDVGPQEEYRLAAELLEKWKSGGVLVQEECPAVYAYEQTFRWGVSTFRRRALVAGVRATPLGQDVIPHEHTFSGPKADRLKLTQYTQMQLSPIFGFFDDAGGVVERLFAGLCCPMLQGELGGVKEAMWAVTDPAVIDGIKAALRQTPVFIADGHHRYTTALNYIEQQRASGQAAADAEVNFVMFALVPRQSSGLMVLPTHRIIRGLGADFTLKGLRETATEFQWRQMQIPADPADIETTLKGFGNSAMGFVEQSSGVLHVATLADPKAMQAVAPDEPHLWSLDVAILHKILIEKHLGPYRAAGCSIDYTPDAAQSLEACRCGQAQLACLLQASPLETIEQVARGGAVMPHKSTYFYPKLSTGMVLKPLSCR